MGSDCPNECLTPTGNLVIKGIVRLLNGIVDLFWRIGRQVSLERYPWIGERLEQFHNCANGDVKSTQHQ